MREVFPELELRRGHYHCPIWGKRQHWWLVTPDNQTVDPTAAQFPSGGLGEYVELDESQTEPTGRCMNCGDLCFDGDTTCSAACLAELSAYYRITTSRG
jgi:hypothetical protein